MTYLITEDTGVVFDVDPSCVDRKIAGDVAQCVTTRLATREEAIAFAEASFTALDLSRFEAPPPPVVEPTTEEAPNL